MKAHPDLPKLSVKVEGPRDDISRVQLLAHIVLSATEVEAKLVRISPVGDSGLVMCGYGPKLREINVVMDGGFSAEMVKRLVTGAKILGGMKISVKGVVQTGRICFGRRRTRNSVVYQATIKPTQYGEEVEIVAGE